jgi:hypothetical protein
MESPHMVPCTICPALCARSARPGSPRSSPTNTGASWRARTTTPPRHAQHAPRRRTQHANTYLFIGISVIYPWQWHISIYAINYISAYYNILLTKLGILYMLRDYKVRACICGNCFARIARCVSDCSVCFGLPCLARLARSARCGSYCSVWLVLLGVARIALLLLVSCIPDADNYYLRWNTF